MSSQLSRPLGAGRAEGRERGPGGGAVQIQGSADSLRCQCSPPPGIRRLLLGQRRFWPTARISWALPILERPSIPSRAASRRSSVTVIAPAPVPVPFVAPRLRAAALAPSRPSALRVFFGSFVIVFFCRAPV